MTTALVIALIVAALVIARVNGLRRRCTESGQKFYDNDGAANQMQEVIDSLDRRNAELVRQLGDVDSKMQFLSASHREMERACNKWRTIAENLAETQFALPTLTPDRGNDEPAAAVIYDELVLGVAS